MQERLFWIPCHALNSFNRKQRELMSTSIKGCPKNFVHCNRGVGRLQCELAIDLRLLIGRAVLVSACKVVGSRPQAALHS